MSEQKVWVEKMPESCSDCPCCNYGNDDEKDYSCNLMKWGEDSLTDDNLINKKPENCPLQSIKTHDRELVKKVCEKIKQDCWYCWCGGAMLEDDYYKVPVKYLQNLQKEYEK